MQENKIKTMKIYFCIFNEHLKCGKTMEKRWNAISKIKQTSLSCMKEIIFFSNKCQYQPTKLLKPDYSADKPGEYLLIVTFLINYIDESFIHTRILMTIK